MHGGCRSTVNDHHHRVAAAGIVVLAINEPALNLHAIAGPMQTLHVTPGSGKRRVAVRHLLPLAHRAGPNFWRLFPGVTNHSGSPPVGGQGNRQTGTEFVGSDDSSPSPKRRDLAASDIDGGDSRLVVDSFVEKNSAGRAPVEIRGRGCDPGSKVADGAAVDGCGEYVAADKSFVAHQPGDEGNTLAVRRPARAGYLEMRLVNWRQGGSSDGERVALGYLQVGLTVAA